MIGYLDAGTGSMITGAIAAGGAGAAVVAKMAWGKISPKKKKKAEEAAAAEEHEEVAATADEAAGDE